MIGQNLQANHVFATRLMNEIQYVPGAVDVRIQQPFNLPRYFVDVDRSKAQTVGLQQKDISSSLLSALSGSFQTAPTYYLDPKNGVEYNIAVQSPQYGLDSLQQLQNIPVTPASAAATPTTTGTPSTAGTESVCSRFKYLRHSAAYSAPRIRWAASRYRSLATWPRLRVAVNSP